MPGTCASPTLSGSGDSQRSGFHSSASSPQIALLRFDASRPTATDVSFGTKISFISFPSTPRTGCASGKTMS